MKILRGSQFDSPLVLSLRGQCLVVISSTTPKIVGCVLVDDRDVVTEESFQMVMNLLQEKEGLGATAKILGSKPILPQVETVLRKLGLGIEKVIERKEPFSCVIDPKELRVRVSVDTASSLSPQVQEVKPRSKKRVLIVDDSATIRKILTQVLSQDQDLEVVGEADRPSVARELIHRLNPDVVTLDIHMPEMDGVAFLQEMMAVHPIRAVMISSLSMEDGNQVLNALESGAVDYIQKPTFDQMNQVSKVIVDKVKTAATVDLRRKTSRPAAKHRSKVSGKPVDVKNGHLQQDALLAIGSSTGGTEALKEVLTKLPADIPPTVIVQHIPAVFSKALADRLNQLCAFQVKEAKHGDILQPGTAYIAPGGLQMKVVYEKGTQGPGTLAVIDSAPVNRHKPSVDVLFDSIVACGRASSTIGVILTGMGADGAQGLLHLRKGGARTLGQSEKTCVVYGMPREAAERGAVEKVCDLDQIADELVRWLSKKPNERAAS